MMGLHLLVCLLVLCYVCVSECDLCPKQCDCDVSDGLNRATCVAQNIVSIDVGVPKNVQFYSLSRNGITELDNFCFKESGYSSLQILDLSYNLIFWIGLHAFSGLDKLVHLDLSNNRLRDIPTDLFWETPQLQTLDLSANVFEALKNEPLLMHLKLEVLNLNSCRIKALPVRLFSRLPNLKKLDLSGNYMVTITTEVFKPLRRLQRLELENEYWHCKDLLAVEAWIAARGITYEPQCKTLPNMFQKMVSTETPELEPTDTDTVWNITETEEDLPSLEPANTPTAFEKFDKEFPAFQAFIIGLEVGLAAGVVGTYVWLRSFCKCRQLTCANVEVEQRRHRGRARAVDSADIQTNLLWDNLLNHNLETPPLMRRELSLPDGSQPYRAYGLSEYRDGRLQVDAIRLPDRPETPPPPYNECRINV